MIPRTLNLFCFLLIPGIITTMTFSQEQFVQFTYYDQLTWSEDGNQLAFRCVLLDESQPEKLISNILIKDLMREQLLCINPQPERFIISKDKKNLLFSSIYGLYLVKLEGEPRAAQIYSRNPTADWYFQDFGFFEEKNKFYILRFDKTKMEIVKENYQIIPSKFNDHLISWGNIEKIENVRSAPFNLHLDEMKGDRTTEIRMKNNVIKFVPAYKPGDYQLIYRSKQQPISQKILLDQCRPRLLSVNPDTSEMLISVFEGEGLKTYRFLFSKKELILIENKRYFSVSWLDNSRYLCITEEGMFLRNIERTINKKLDNWQRPEWCHQIDLTFPNYELQVGFEPEERLAEQIASQLLKSGYLARIKYYKDQAREGYRIRVGGFKTRRQAQLIGEELKKKGFNFWIDQLTDLYDYFNSIKSVERKSLNDKTALIQYKFDNYLRSRIILMESNKKKRILVNEMNNIPGQSSW